MHVSSVAKDAFASHVNGCLPLVTEGVRCSACSRVKAAVRPTHGRHFDATNTARRSTAGYSTRTVPRFASPEALRRGLGRSDLFPREKSERSSGAVEDGVSRRGNSGTAVDGRKWHRAYGSIPTLKDGAFSCVPRNDV